MKLHLPKGLLAAVLALFASGFALHAEETSTTTIYGWDNNAPATSTDGGSTWSPITFTEVSWSNKSLDLSGVTNAKVTNNPNTSWGSEASISGTADALWLSTATGVRVNILCSYFNNVSNLYLNGVHLVTGADGNAAASELTSKLFLGSGLWTTNQDNAVQQYSVLRANVDTVFKNDVSLSSNLVQISTWGPSADNGRNLTFEKALNGEGKHLSIGAEQTGSVVTFESDVNLGALSVGSRVDGSNVVSAAGAAISVSVAGMANIGTLDLQSGSTLTVESTGRLTLQNLDAGELSNEGLLHLTNYNAGTLTNTGMVRFASSSSLGTMLSVGGTLDLSAITTLNVDAADWRNFTLSDYSKPESNGYYGGMVTLLSYTGDGTVSIGEITGAGWLKGATISYDGTEKQLQATFASDSGVYCVVSDTDTTTNVALSDSKTTSIVLDNARLGLDSGWDDLKGISSLGGTINIASGASLSSANLQATAATKLDGAGQYIISSPGAAISNLGSNVSLADNWTGVVTVSGGSDGSSLSNLAKDGNSTIEFKGFSGYDNVSDAWKGTMAYNVKLTNDGDAVAWSNSAWVTPNEARDNIGTGTFSGKWSGTGTFMAKVDGNKCQDYKYTGDISEWTGEFCLNNGTTNLTFSGNANDVKIDIGGLPISLRKTTCSHERA